MKSKRRKDKIAMREEFGVSPVRLTERGASHHMCTGVRQHIPLLSSHNYTVMASEHPAAFPQIRSSLRVVAYPVAVGVFVGDGAEWAGIMPMHVCTARPDSNFVVYAREKKIYYLWIIKKMNHLRTPYYLFYFIFCKQQNIFDISVHPRRNESINK
eukprot:gene8632-6063_t